MTRESAYFKEIERLLANGFEPKHITKITGIPQSTVYRIVEKLRTEARMDFNQLMDKDYLWKYQQNLENFSRTIQECNEEIVTMRKKYDEIEAKMIEELEGLPDSKAMVKATILASLVSLQSAKTNEFKKIVDTRDKASETKARIYNAGPVVYAIDNWVRNTHPENGNAPMLALDEPPKEYIPLKLNTIQPTDNDEPSDEELRVLKEMEEDENNNN